MKLTLLLLALLALPNWVDAAELKSAKFNPLTNSIEVELVYSGGCRTHDFRLKLGVCHESSPVVCEAEVIDLMQTDSCEALVPATARFPLLEYGLMDPYFSKGTIKIKGDNRSEVSVTMPSL